MTDQAPLIAVNWDNGGLKSGRKTAVFWPENATKAVWREQEVTN